MLSYQTLYAYQQAKHGADVPLMVLQLGCRGLELQWLRRIARVLCGEKDQEQPPRLICEHPGITLLPGEHPDVGKGRAF